MKAPLLIPFLFIPLLSFAKGPFLYVEYEITPKKITGFVQNRHKRFVTCKGLIIGISGEGNDKNQFVKNLAKGYRFARGEKKEFWLNALPHNHFFGAKHNLKCSFR